MHSLFKIQFVSRNVLAALRVKTTNVEWSFYSSSSSEEHQLEEEEEDYRKQAEHEIEKKMNISRMPPHMKSRMNGIPLKPEELLSFQPAWVSSRNHKNIRRKKFGIYGKSSGIEPGSLWPTAEELQEKIKYEKVCYPLPLQAMMQNILTKKEEEKLKRELREKDVLEKHAKMEMWVKEFENRKQKKLAEALEQKRKKEKLIEEVRAYLGFQIDVNDERFKEILQEKEKEQKKAEKEAKKKEKIARELAKLTAQAAAEKKSAEEIKTEQRDKTV